MVLSKLGPVLTVAVLISGTGSNLRALLEAAAEADFPARVIVVGADREASGLAHAEEFGIPSFVIPWQGADQREAWGEELDQQLRVWQPDLVVLSGLMRLLPPAVLAACRAQADAWMAAQGAKPRSTAGAVMVVVVWIAVGLAAWYWLAPRLAG